MKGIIASVQPRLTFFLVQFKIIPICVIRDAYKIVNISPGILFYGALTCAFISSFVYGTNVKLSNVILYIS